MKQENNERIINNKYSHVVIISISLGYFAGLL